ncbi:MAG TPA: ATP-binding cassette domain-containing protein [Nitriliruptoraceae bacterium]|nr:ATP-binding cassette domain-containing protein [Nitriliruptoraceae bacterium]
MTESSELLESVVTPTIAMRGITKNFGGETALEDVHLEVRPGEVHALLGENGAGKSTLMGVASGTLQPDGGSITVEGAAVEFLTPNLATKLGIGIVHQHPRLLPDLTVEENLQLTVSADRLGEDPRRGMQQVLDVVRFDRHLRDRVDSLTVAESHLLELAKALALKPALLILDEPTASFGRDEVETLFDLVREVAARGTAVVYITHRLAEVRMIADRVTVLRDGHNQGTGRVDELTDDDVLRMIVGRELDHPFPPKSEVGDDAPTVLEVEGLSGDDFHDISLSLRRGEILGVAGVVGNGQTALLRALAGLDSSTGVVSLQGRSSSPRELAAVSAYMPADRHREGLVMEFSARENAALSSLPRYRGPLRLLSRRSEHDHVEREFTSLAVKAPSIEAPASSLSGGNQQKVVTARALLSEPAVLVADEPTQGVDVGARTEIYRILREVAANGTPVVVASSDAAELEGLCDRVVVMSRGRAVAVLDGADVAEERIITAAVASDVHDDSKATAEARASTPLRRFLTGDHAPVVVLALVMLGLGAYLYFDNPAYLSAFNITSVQMLVAAGGFIALGQTAALLTGGLDLSVGPLAGFLVVVGSFFLNESSGGGAMALGLVVMVVAAAAVGLVNGSLVRFVRFTPVAATLVTYTALGGLSFLLRESPGGIMARSVTDVIGFKIGPIPVAFIVLVVLSIALEYLLRRSRWGRELRAIGSNEEGARQAGVQVDRTALMAYVLVSLLTFLGALVLVAQIGIGDPAQGVGYTLSSITAVVLGGTSLLGGRGTFVGSMLGAGLIVQVMNATTFLGLSQVWQYFFQGALIVLAAIIYSQVRGSRA